MKTLRRFFPLTLNALILLLASAYCLSLIAKTDLLATIFAVSLIGLIFIVTIIVGVNFVILRRKLALEIIRHSSAAIQYLDRPVFINLEIKNLQIFPLCQVKIKLIFKHSRFSPPALILKTKQQELTAAYQVDFPHHGEWKLEQIEYSVSDFLGLAVIIGIKNTENFPIIKVEPPRLFTPELPLVFSSLTAGDVINIPQKKMGDYYDLKKYHPSDGISKIVWKIFARNQALIARHPEDTALPAGKSLVCLFADEKSPELARHCLNYLEQIGKKDLEFIFDCSGVNQPVLNDLTMAKELILANVWTAKATKWEANYPKFNQLLGKEHSCLEIAIFMEDNNPIRKPLLAHCKAKGVKVLLITSKQPVIATSKLNNFLFHHSKKDSRLRTQKISSQYV